MLINNNINYTLIYITDTNKIIIFNNGLNINF